MAGRLSRRKIASYYAKSLASGKNTDDLALKLAAYLIETGRTRELSLMISDIEYQLSLNGVVLANVTSAHDLDEQTKKAIIKLISDSTKADKVSLSEHLDPDVLGGIRLNFAGNELDTTISRQLTALKTNYKK